MKKIPAIKELLRKANLEQTLLIEEVLRICADECKTIKRDTEVADWRMRRADAAESRLRYWLSETLLGDKWIASRLESFWKNGMTKWDTENPEPPKP